MHSEARLPNARAIRISMGVRSLAIAVVLVSAWELIAGGLMDPDPGRLLWLVPAGTGLEGWLASRNLHAASGIGATRPVSRAAAGWSGWAVLWLARFGFALAIVAAWNALKTLLALAWIDVHPLDPQVWSARLMLWTVLLLVGSGLSRSWRADSARRAEDLPARSGEAR